MKIQTGEKYLITTDNWFFGPDGAQYRAVWGTVHNVSDAEQTLGIKTNRNSTNWYVSIGSMILAGCQIHYAIRTDIEPSQTAESYLQHDGEYVRSITKSSVLNADQDMETST